MNTPRQQQPADPFHRICGWGAALVLAAVVGAAMHGGQPASAGFAQWAARSAPRHAVAEPAQDMTAGFATAAWDEAFARGF